MKLGAGKIAQNARNPLVNNRKKRFHNSSDLHNYDGHCLKYGYFCTILFYLGTEGKDKYVAVYEIVRAVLDENGGECNCKKMSK